MSPLMRSHGRAIVALLVFGAVSVAPLAVPAASAEPLGGFCQHVGQVRPDPGLGLEAKDFTFKFKGNVGPCQMADGSTRWGVEYGRGTANGNCGLRTATATWTIRWNTGTRTVIPASFGGVGNVITTSGTISEGEFAGGLFQDAHVLSGFDPVACTSPGGVTAASYQGAFAIGAAE